MNIKEKYNTSSAETKAGILTMAIMLIPFVVTALIFVIPWIVVPVASLILITGAAYIVYGCVLSIMEYNERHKDES